MQNTLKFAVNPMTVSFDDHDCHLSADDGCVHFSHEQI